MPKIRLVESDGDDTFSVVVAGGDIPFFTDP